MNNFIKLYPLYFQIPFYYIAFYLFKYLLDTFIPLLNIIILQAVVFTYSGVEIDYSLLFRSFESILSDVVINNCNSLPVLGILAPVFNSAKAIFMNPQLERSNINRETKSKTGIYCWVNKVNGNTYVGSGLSLYKRISNYYQPSYYLREANLLIVKAINKHGLDNFALVILEYTHAKFLIEREQYWIDKIEPAYNMIKTPGIIFSSDHHRKTIDRKGIRNSFWGKKHTDETKLKMKAIALKRATSNAPSTTVEVTDCLTNTTIVYSSISKAALALGHSHHANLTARKRRNTQNLYKGRYVIKFKDTRDKNTK